MLFECWLHALTSTGLFEPRSGAFLCTAVQEEANEWHWMITFSWVSKEDLSLNAIQSLNAGHDRDFEQVYKNISVRTTLMAFQMFLQKKLNCPL